MSSMLVVAALYRLLTGGDSIYGNTICKTENKNFLDSINTASSASKLTMKYDKIENFLTKKASNLGKTLPLIIKPQMDIILKQFDEVKQSKFWEKQDANSTILATTYSADQEVYGLYLLGFSRNENSVRTNEIKFATQYKGATPLSYAASAYVAPDENGFTDDTTEDNKNDVDETITAIEIGLAPLMFGTQFHSYFNPLINSALCEIEKGNLPEGVTENNKEIVITNLKKMLDDSFSFNLNEYKKKLSDKCSKH